MVKKHHHHHHGTRHHGGGSSSASSGGSAHHHKKKEETDEKRQQRKMFGGAYSSAPVKQVLVASSTVDRQQETSGAPRRHDVIEKGAAPQKALNPVDQIIAAAIATERERQRQQQGSSGVRSAHHRVDDRSSHSRAYVDEYNRVKMVKPTRHVAVEDGSSSSSGERRQHKVKPDKRYYD